MLNDDDDDDELIVIVEKAPQLVEVKIKFSQGNGIILVVSPKIKIRELKKKLFDRVKKEKEEKKSTRSLEGKYIKLIYEGKILGDEFDLIHYKIETEDTIHCSVSDFPSRSVFRNAFINTTEVVDENDPNVLRGFDRMTEQGFTTEEVESFREQFYSTRQYLLTQFRNGEITESEIREREEEWMNEEDPHQRDNLTSFNLLDTNYRIQIPTGSDVDLLLGIIVGFFFGILNFLLLCNNFFGNSKKFKYGVLFGLTVNVILSIFGLFIKPPY